MFKKNYHIKINLPGGIVTPGELYAIVQAAEQARVPYLQVGTRQQLFCKVADKYGAALLEALDLSGIGYEAGTELYPNIVSSYVTEGIFEKGGGGSWLSEGIYKDILGAFDYRPGLKVNLVEGQQSFVPYFTGNINFISSGTGNYWHLYLRWPKTSFVFSWRGLIYSEDIPGITRLIEEEMAVLMSVDGLGGMRGDGLGDAGGMAERLCDRVRERGRLVMQPERELLEMPRFDLPYYEGFNRYGTKTWLGIYRREEQYAVALLKDISQICLKTRIGQLYTTPWKSLIIKGIEERDRALWKFVMGKHRINLRHGASELNWQTEDGSDEGLRLKRYLVRQLDIEDTRTEGLCFAIKTRPGTGLSGSVIIRRCQQRVGRGKEMERYDILHTPDFNVNSKEYIVYREGLEKEHLAVYLVSLCKHFFEQESKVASPQLLQESGPQTTAAASGASVEEWVYQCGGCLTLYDPEYGDITAGVVPGLAFAEVAADYCCPVCGGEKAAFVPVEKRMLIQE